MVVASLLPLHYTAMSLHYIAMSLHYTAISLHYIAMSLHYTAMSLHYTAMSLHYITKYLRYVTSYLHNITVYYITRYNQIHAFISARFFFFTKNCKILLNSCFKLIPAYPNVCVGKSGGAAAGGGQDLGAVELGET